MGRTRNRNRWPSGLRTQIVFAVALTIGALFMLPTALSARQALIAAPASAKMTAPSAGSVATTIQEFRTGDFAASQFTDWD